MPKVMGEISTASPATTGPYYSANDPCDQPDYDRATRPLQLSRRSAHP
ncbi:hypothetical protein FHS20_003918 [Phyllobacterium endophyticum]|nr:hypothetical protein [Phyllobacterium endophyticum]